MSNKHKKEPNCTYAEHLLTPPMVIELCANKYVSISRAIKILCALIVNFDLVHKSNTNLTIGVEIIYPDNESPKIEVYLKGYCPTSGVELRQYVHYTYPLSSGIKSLRVMMTMVRSSMTQGYFNPSVNESNYTLNYYWHDGHGVSMAVGMSPIHKSIDTLYEEASLTSQSHVGSMVFSKADAIKSLADPTSWWNKIMAFFVGELTMDLGEYTYSKGMRIKIEG